MPVSYNAVYSGENEAMENGRILPLIADEQLFSCEYGSLSVCFEKVRRRARRILTCLKRGCPLQDQLFFIWIMWAPKYYRKCGEGRGSGSN